MYAEYYASNVVACVCDKGLLESCLEHMRQIIIITARAQSLAGLHNSFYRLMVAFCKLNCKAMSEIAIDSESQYHWNIVIYMYINNNDNKNSGRNATNKLIWRS